MAAAAMMAAVAFLSSAAAVAALVTGFTEIARLLAMAAIIACIGVVAAR